MGSWKLNIKDGKEYFRLFTHATDKEYVTMNGSITQKGYKLYLSFLGILGKNSMHGSKPRKSYVWFFNTDELLEQSYIIYDEVSYNYILTNKGMVLTKVLARSLENNGVPKI